MIRKVGKRHIRAVAFTFLLLGFRVQSCRDAADCKA